MKNKIIQTFCSLIVTLALMAGLATALVPTNEPPEPRQVIEAPIFRSIQVWVAWLKTVDWSNLGSGDSKWKFKFLPDPSEGS
ncbi:MAG: hypothetical protein ACE1ZM_07665 [Gammaproteobacteria bacterium]